MYSSTVDCTQPNMLEMILYRCTYIEQEVHTSSPLLIRTAFSSSTVLSTISLRMDRRTADVSLEKAYSKVTKFTLVLIWYTTQTH